MKRGLVIVGIVALLTSSASAAIEQGQYELGALFSYTRTDYTGNGNRDVLALDLDFAYFVTDNLSMGIDLSGDWRDGTSNGYNSKSDQVYYGIKGKYHVMTDRMLVPYFGFTAGLTDVKVESSSTSTSHSGHYFGGLLGARYELNASNDLYLEYQYKKFGGDIKDDYEFDSDQRIMIGILHQFN